MATVRELIFKITGDNEKFKTAIDESKKPSMISIKNKNASDLYGSIAKQAAIATTAIAAVGIATAKMAVEFNEGFGKVQTLIPGATERIAELEENVLNLSPAVGKTTKDLTEGLYEIISAFGDSADSAKNLELAAKGATAGGATTKESIKLLSAVTKAYGNTSFEAQKRVSDLAFTTLKLGQTSMSDLAVSMQRVTSMSNVLGVSQEELFAIFSSGTGVIGGAAEVSTKLSAVYTELQKPQERLAKSFKELGVATGEELIAKFGGLSGALQALKSVADKTGNLLVIFSVLLKRGNSPCMRREKELQNSQAT
ncbi:phage tail tape measure protein [Treponema phagedenis]|uniref:phage tail tape measure protein n=1 Tax=Treponema phagedenis TaxID=162 RepID=UPI0021CC7681|nr:phage tail tape measure protein [Treponema phagedenis]